MYGVGQSTPQQRRGLRVILGVMLLVLMLVGLFYAFYALVLKKDPETPSATVAVEATATVQVAGVATETSRPAISTATSAPVASTATSASAASTATRTASPTDTPSPAPTLRPPPEVITVGVRATVNLSEGLGLNLRDLPSLNGSVVITQLVAGTQVDVTAGPEDAADLRWWNVDGGGGRSGWVVEAFGGETWIVPTGWSDQMPPLSVAAPAATPVQTPVATPTQTPTTAPAEETPTATFTPTPAATTEVEPAATAVVTPTTVPEGDVPPPTVGGRARVTTRYQYINLRAAPGLDAEAIGQLADGTVVTILEGPEEANEIRWWKVDDGQGGIGWAAERVAEEVLLTPIQ